jgi:ABC-type bacteriocin/lantibiotic exporter with double-glycine peptidase domain
MKKLLNFPPLRQVYQYDCGANAIQGVLDYYGIDVREGVILKMAGTTKSGTNIRGVKKVADYFGLKYKDGAMTISDLKKWIDKKIPVIIVLQAWTEQEKVNWAKDWKDGHYVTVIGYSKKRIYFSDPSCERETFLTYKELEKRWHDRDVRWKKVINWGMAVWRPKSLKKVKRRFCTDFWSKDLKPGFYYKEAVHMD